MHDLISRQDVFDMIDAVFREECEKRNTTYEEADEMTQWYLCGMMKVMEKVFDIPSASRWIPVSERLPEPCMAVLGYAPKYQNIYALYYDSACGWMIWNPIRDDYLPENQGEITAWMPLPDPYKEGER